MSKPETIGPIFFLTVDPIIDAEMFVPRYTRLLNQGSAMINFSKSQKSFVIQWIDHKFSTDDLFPYGCAVTIEGEQKVGETHVKAYKRWSLTPHK